MFQYDGTLSCTGFEFGLLVLIGLAVVVFFVAPAPLAVGYICRKRPLVCLVSWARGNLVTNSHSLSAFSALC